MYGKISFVLRYSRQTTQGQRLDRGTEKGNKVEREYMAGERAVKRDGLYISFCVYVYFHFLQLGSGERVNGKRERVKGTAVREERRKFVQCGVVCSVNCKKWCFSI